MTPTQQIRQRPRNDAEDAMILVWLLLAAVAGVVYYLAYARFHLRPNQLVELTLYPAAYRVLSLRVPSLRCHPQKQT